MTNFYLNFKIIGCGGIGSYLIPPLLRYLHVTWPYKLEIMLIDGDVFHENNLNRQNFYEDQLGMNKANAFKEEYSNIFDNVSLRSFMSYVDKNTIKEVISESSFIFLCVDNHNTRKLISDYCQKLKNVVLISGGNELIDGNIQVYLRFNDEDITDPITKFHPEIDNPKDKNPSEMSCEELSNSDNSQIIMTNFMAASLMLNAFYCITQHSNTIYNEVNFNILRNIVIPDKTTGDKQIPKKIYIKKPIKFRKITVKETGDLVLTLTQLTNFEQDKFKKQIAYSNRILIGEKTKNKRNIQVIFE